MNIQNINVSYVRNKKNWRDLCFKVLQGKLFQGIYFIKVSADASKACTRINICEIIKQP